MFEEIKKLLVECAHVDENEVTLDANLKKDLGIDSLYAAELTLELEEHYGIAIEWEEMQEVYTVKDVVDLIEKKVGR
jgi:acyl carrier protein